MLAYGSVPLVRRAIVDVLSHLGSAPTETLRAWRPGMFLQRHPSFVYRMTRAEDVDVVLSAMAEVMRRDGSLGATFRRCMRRGDTDVREPLRRYVAYLREAGGSSRRGVRYLLPDPSTGSASKRWFLMLRWLVRGGDYDLNQWTWIAPRDLVLPLDRHVASIVQALGMTTRRSADYRMAREATDVLLELDADDPLRFDMPLCHLGISRACVHAYRAEICGVCALAPWCVHYATQTP